MLSPSFSGTETKRRKPLSAKSYNAMKSRLEARPPSTFGKEDDEDHAAR